MDPDCKDMFEKGNYRRRKKRANPLPNKPLCVNTIDYKPEGRKVNDLPVEDRRNISVEERINDNDEQANLLRGHFETEHKNLFFDKSHHNAACLNVLSNLNDLYRYDVISALAINWLAYDPIIQGGKHRIVSSNIFQESVSINNDPSTVKHKRNTHELTVNPLNSQSSRRDSSHNIEARVTNESKQSQELSPHTVPLGGSVKSPTGCGDGRPKPTYLIQDILEDK